MSLLHIPFVAGESDKIDRKILPNGTLRRAENLRLRKDGRLGKRYGLKDQLSTNAFAASPVAALAPDGRILESGLRQVLVNAGGSYFIRSPAVCRHPSLLPESAEGFSNTQYGTASFDETCVFYGNFLICAARFEANHSTAASASSVVVVQVRDLRTGKITETATHTGYRRPRLLQEASGFVLVMENFAAGTIRATRYGVSTQGSLSVAVALTTVGTIIAGSTWDVSSQSTSVMLLAYQSAANTITANTITVAAFATTNTATVVPGAATYFCTIAGYSSTIWLIWKTSGTTAIDFRTYTGTLGGASATTAFVATSSGAEKVIAGYDSNRTQVSVVWDTTGLGTTARSMGYGTITAGGAVSTYNANLYSPRSRPFVFRGEMYCLAACDGGLVGEIYGTLYRNVVYINLTAGGTAGTDGLVFVEAEHGYGFADEEDVFVGAGPTNWLSDAQASGDLACAAYSYATSDLVSTTPAARRATYPVALVVRGGTTNPSSYQLPTAQGLNGGAAGSIDDGRDVFVGFRHAPILRTTVESNGAGNLTATGVYVWYVVWEHIDAQGNRTFSEPSPAAARTLTGVNDTVTLTIDPCPWAGGTSVKLHVYRSVNAGTTHYEINESPVLCPAGADVTVVDLTSDATLVSGAILYTLGGVLPNRPVPAARCLYRGDDRVVVTGFDPTVGEFSKLFVPGEGVAFADHEAFRVKLPDKVRAWAQLDGTWIALCANGIYAVTGVGPDDRGIGTFSAPQKLPGGVGCVEFGWRSVLVTPVGIIFQSQRGMYLLPRGFGAPIFIGEAIQDVLSSYSEVTSAVLYGRGMGTDEIYDLRGRGEMCALFLCRQPGTSNVTGLVYDLEKQQWFRDTYIAEGPLHVQLWDEGTLFFSSSLATGTHWLNVLGASFGEDVSGSATFLPSVIETGSIRPGGLVRMVRSRRVALLGEWRSACSVTLSLSTNDGQSYGYSRTWNLTSGYSAGDSVRLLWRLPVQVSDSLVFKVTDSAAAAGEGVAFTGLALEVEPRKGLTRVRQDAA